VGFWVCWVGGLVVGWGVGRGGQGRSRKRKMKAGVNQRATWGRLGETHAVDLLKAEKGQEKDAFTSTAKPNAVVHIHIQQHGRESGS